MKYFRYVLILLHTLVTSQFTLPCELNPRYNERDSRKCVINLAGVSEAPARFIYLFWWHVADWIILETFLQFYFTVHSLDVVILPFLFLAATSVTVTIQFKIAVPQTFWTLRSVLAVFVWHQGSRCCLKLFYECRLFLTK